jgi:hypothetical protein
MTDTETELEMMCDAYAEELDEIARGGVKKCADCDTRYIKHVSKKGNVSWTPGCGCAKHKGIKTEYTIADYVANDTYDVNYTIRRDGSLKGVEFMIAGGDPNIYVNTNTKQVEGYWGGGVYKCPLPDRVVDALEEEAEYMLDNLSAYIGRDRCG